MAGLESPTPEWGVLEPLQTAGSLDGQVVELKTVLKQQAALPVTLIGFSWGAWLSFIVAARYPALVKKLILVGSGPFEENYATGIEKTRLSRLSFAERAEVALLMEVLRHFGGEGQATAFARFGALLSKTDAYDPVRYESDLARISGVGPVFARLLYEAGAETVEVLAGKSAEPLFEQLRAINEVQQYTKAMASLKDVRYCIETANALPKIIEV